MKKTNIRQQAEEKLNQKKTAATPATDANADTARLVYELQVHQIELEMQNEQLVQARAEAVHRQYTDLHDFAPVGYFTLARDGAISRVNLAGADLLGDKHGEIAKRRLGQFVPTQSLETLNAFLERVFTSGKIETCEMEFLKSGSTPLWVQLKAVTDSDERETCRVVVVDITERKQAETALLESEERFRLLFESMESGFALHEIICDDQGTPCDYRFLEINPAFEKLTGLKAKALLGHTNMEMLPGTEKEWIERYGKVALTGESVHFDSYAQELGKYYQVSAYSPRHGQFAVIFQDITELKQAEAQREAVFEALQKKIDELERWQSLTVGRELMMIELKKEINALLEQFGQPQKYKIVDGTR